MTPGEKLFLLHEQGRKWGEIANILGVSRQFLTRVRSGEKRLSSAKMKILDDLVSINDTQNGTHEVVKESQPRYDPDHRLTDLELRVTELERAVIRLANHPAKCKQ
jgi:predicted transcriptional regulator